jgi:hypothetical protein
MRGSTPCSSKSWRASSTRSRANERSPITEVWRAHSENLLDLQLQHELATLEQAIGRALDVAERAEFVNIQRCALRQNFVDAGALHPAFVDTLERISPRVRAHAVAIDSV